MVWKTLSKVQIFGAGEWMKIGLDYWKGNWAGGKDLALDTNCRTFELYPVGKYSLKFKLNNISSIRENLLKFFF